MANRYLFHDLDPATQDRKTDLEPYISEESMLLALVDVGSGDTDYPPKQLVVDQTIEDAEVTVEGYCRRHYKIPLDSASPQTDPPTTPPPDILKAIGRIAAYSFWSRGGAPTQNAKDEYEMTVKWLRDVSTQKVKLDSELKSGTATEGGYLVTSVYQRRISQDTMPQ